VCVCAKGGGEVSHVKDDLPWKRHAADGEGLPHALHANSPPLKLYQVGHLSPAYQSQCWQPGKTKN